MPLKQAAVLSLLFASVALPEDNIVPLKVPAGVPLRLYLTKRLPKRAGAPVQARMLAPVFAFDREVIPTGTVAIGRVSSVVPVSKWTRARAILAGDFTPLRIAEVEFTSLKFPDGHELAVHTDANPGLNSLFPFRPPKQRTVSDKKVGVIEAGKQRAKDQIDNQIERVKSIPEVVRGTNKVEWLTDYLMAKLPYHPQYVRNRTRFDAELRDPLDFGSHPITRDELALAGSQPAAGSVAHARLLQPLDSKDSKQGDTVGAVLEQPLFSTDHRLILPEGTHVNGTVVMAKPAGWFHHGGRLRFSFQNIDVPPLVARLQSDMPQQRQATLQFRTQATLKAAESDKAPLKVDTEGGVQATESKTRFIGTLLALMIARSSADNDVRRNSSGAITNQNSNVGASTFGGGLGFGMLGSIAAQSSRAVATSLGFYGLAWNVYSTVVARGKEVEFNKNAVVDIGFTQRTAQKLAAEGK